MTAEPVEAPVPLSLDELDAIVDDAEERSHAENTRQTYVKALRAYTRWCTPHAFTPIPTTTKNLGRWAADLRSRGLTPATIKTYTSAIRSIHTQPWLAGLTPPAEPWPVPALTAVDKVVRTYSKDLSHTGWQPRKAEAMLLSDLRRIKASMAPEGVLKRLIDTRDWAILTLGFAMGGRRSELACLDIDHIAIDPEDPEWMMVRICSSKTDQSGAGEVVMIKRAADHTVCAVGAVFDWLVCLRMEGVTSGPLFRQCSGAGTSLATNGMATTPDGLSGRMTGKAISLRYTARSLRAEIKIKDFGDRLKRFTGHSGRRGAATEAAKAGATHERMCTHFRWVKGSRMAFEYVVAADKRENNPMAAVM